MKVERTEDRFSGSFLQLELRGVQLLYKYGHFLLECCHVLSIISLPSGTVTQQDPNTVVVKLCLYH